MARRYTITELSTINVPVPDIYGTGISIGNLTTAAGSEMVFGSGSDLNDIPVSGRVTAVNAAGATVWTYQSANDDYPLNMQIADVDEDGVNEVAVAFRLLDTCGTLLEADGTERWSYDMGVGYVRAVAIGKLTANAGKQVFFGDEVGHSALLTKAGVLIWEKTEGSVTGNNTVQTAIIADTDGDGQNEIIIGFNAYIRKINAAGTQVWSTELLTPDAGTCVFCVAAGNIRTDLPGLEIVGVLGRNVVGRNRVVLLGSDGTLLWSRYFHTGAWSCTTGVVNGRTRIFVAIGTHNTETGSLGDGAVLMMNQHGDTLATFPMVSAKGMTWGDANNDGLDELCVTCDDGKIHILRVAAV